MCLTFKQFPMISFIHSSSSRRVENHFNMLYKSNYLNFVFIFTSSSSHFCCWFRTDLIYFCQFCNFFFYENRFFQSSTRLIPPRWYFGKFDWAQLFLTMTRFLGKWKSFEFFEDSQSILLEKNSHQVGYQFTIYWRESWKIWNVPLAFFNFPQRSVVCDEQFQLSLVTNGMKLRKK